MKTIEGVDHQLLATLTALGDYLDDVVLVGGWVPHIYSLMWPSEGPIELRRTFDVDAAVQAGLPVRGGSRLDAQLTRQGYVVHLGGISGPAAQVFVNPENEDLLDIEFLCPLTGAGQVPTLQIQEGVVAQALRYLNILLDNAIPVALGGQLRGGHTVKLRIRVPTPGAFIYHRGLAFVERNRPQMRGKDLYYVYEIWMNHPRLRDDIVRQIAKLRRGYPARWYRRFRANFEGQFSSDVAEGVLLVSEQYDPREPTELAHRRIYQAFRGILEAIPAD